MFDLRISRQLPPLPDVCWNWDHALMLQLRYIDEQNAFSFLTWLYMYMLCYKMRGLCILLFRFARSFKHATRIQLMLMLFNMMNTTLSPSAELHINPSTGTAQFKWQRCSVLIAEVSILNRHRINASSSFSLSVFVYTEASHRKNVLSVKLPIALNLKEQSAMSVR